MNKEKILITGGSGFLGWNLCNLAAMSWEVYATYLNHPLTIPGVNLIKVDLTDLAALKILFAEIKPNAVIHTAALSNPNYCQNHPQQAYAVNVTASLNIARLSADYNIRCVFTSSDLVFNGLNPPYQESDRVSPISYYGEQKVQAEQGMLKIYPQVTICRMPLMFGAAPPTANSFMQPFLATLRAGKELFLFTDEFRTPVSAVTAASGLLLTLEKSYQGILHLGGKQRISRYEFGCLMTQIWELPVDNIKGCLQKDVPMAAPRSPDVSLDSSKAFNLGYQPLSLEEQLISLKAEL